MPWTCGLAPFSLRGSSLGAGLQSHQCPWLGQWLQSASPAFPRKDKVNLQNGAMSRGQATSSGVLRVKGKGRERGPGAILPPQTFPSRLTNFILRPKSHGLDLTSSQEEEVIW